MSDSAVNVMFTFKKLSENFVVIATGSNTLFFKCVNKSASLNVRMRWVSLILRFNDTKFCNIAKTLILAI